MKRVTLQDYKERMLCVLVYIQQHRDGPLTLDVDDDFAPSGEIGVQTIPGGD